EGELITRSISLDRTGSLRHRLAVDDDFALQHDVVQRARLHIDNERPGMVVDPNMATRLEDTLAQPERVTGGGFRNAARNRTPSHPLNIGRKRGFLASIENPGRNTEHHHE